MMAMKVDNKQVSETAWGDVDKAALGRRLAEAYAAGDATAAVIREAYAFVPAEALGKDGDGNPVFAFSKGWGPHHELDGDTLILNRGGVIGGAQALAGARSAPSLTGADLASAKRHIRKHYREQKMEAPDSLKESLPSVAVHQPLAEMTKGSFEYAADEVWRAFRDQYGAPESPGMAEYFPVETFPEALIVSEWSSDEGPDEFYRVSFAKDADGKIVFADREAWEPVELTYQPRTEVGEQPPMTESDHGQVETQGGETPPLQRRRLDERVAPLAELAGAGNGATRKIQIRGLMQAGVINGNGRRYPAHVLEAAVAQWRDHLRESAGQGRLKILTGEVEHPGDKGKRGAQFLETVVRWTDVTFDGASVDVAGELILTTRGRDVATLMESGVRPGGSVRGFYEAKIVKEGDRSVEDVAWCQITGADLVGDPSFENAADLLESRARGQGSDLDESNRGDDEMTAEQLAEMIKAHPEMFKGMVAESVKEMSEAQRADLEKKMRDALGLEDSADLLKGLAEAADAKRQMAKAVQEQAVVEAIKVETKTLPYGKELNEAFVKAVQTESLRFAQGDKPAEAVKAFVEGKRAEYDAIAAAAKLAGMGRGIQVLGPVLERETGVPEFARGAHEFSEAMIARGIAQRRNLQDPKTINEIAAARLLERFDVVYKLPLLREAKLLAETELASDLNLPYSASRAILAEVWPQLVATSIFDVDITDQSPTRVYYEDYQDVSGKHAAITNESVALTGTGLAAWKSLAHKMIEPGTIVVGSGSGPSGTTYVEGTDYVIDYLDGAIYCASGLTIGATDTLYMNYHYDSVREGENTAIQRAKMVLGYATLDCQANRLATQITNEAIVFSRSQIGWDATARTLAGLVSELRREIDRALMYNALTRALIVSANSGGTWTAATDPLIDLVSYVGTAKVKLAKRYFEPNWLLLSLTNSDTLANWEGFTAAGARPDAELNANGFIGRLKGLPVYASTEFSDGYGLVGNKQVVHYRIYQPMALKGPYPSYSSDKLVAADQWYAEQYDGAVSPVAGKASYLKIA
jgi:hypothetical protein